MTDARQPTQPIAPLAGRGSARTRLAASAVALVALVGLVACGQKGGNDTTPTQNESQGSTNQTAGGGVAPTTRVRSTATTGSPGSTARRSTTTARSGSSSTSTKVPVSISASAENREFCQAFADFTNNVTLNNSSLDDIPAFLAEVKRQFQTLTSVAPPAIKSDWENLNAKVQTVTEATFFDLNNDAEFKAATDRITEWTKTNCGFDPNGSSSSGGSSSGNDG